MNNPYFVINQCKQEPEDLVITNPVIQELGRSVYEFIDHKDPWHFMLEDWKVGDEKDGHYILDISSITGVGKTLAVQKMNTLRRYPKIANTRDVKDIELLEDETFFYGGINVRYSGFEGLEMKPVVGVVRIVFSGAREAIDLVIVLRILSTYIAACKTFIPNSVYIYDLNLLKCDQLSGYLIKGIKGLEEI